VAHACFRPVTSSVAVVSGFVANGYQIMQHVSIASRHGLGLYLFSLFPAGFPPVFM
jgi:hypothetical protein